MTIPAYSISGFSITIIWEGKSYTIQKGSSGFDELRKAIYEEDWDEIPKYLSVGSCLKNWAKGKFTVDSHNIYYDGAQIPPELYQRILAMAQNDENPTSIFNFWERLQKNPSKRSVDQLWKFLEHVGIPLCEDGSFLAYKAVNDDYTDCHTSKISNRPGTTNEMPRNQISDDPQQPCHEGFHVGALEYARTFGGSCTRVVICKIDPADVVCVPYDESHRKMRVCKYTVTGNYGSTLPSTSFVEEKPKTVKKATVKGFAKLSKLDTLGLLGQPIKALRKYATHGLKIVGASKIPGGKKELIARIIKVR